MIGDRQLYHPDEALGEERISFQCAPYRHSSSPCGRVLSTGVWRWPSQNIIVLKPLGHHVLRDGHQHYLLCVGTGVPRRPRHRQRAFWACPIVEVTGFEPAASCTCSSGGVLVLFRCSAKLSYTSIARFTPGQRRVLALASTVALTARTGASEKTIDTVGASASAGGTGPARLFGRLATLVVF